MNVVKLLKTLQMKGTEKMAESLSSQQISSRRIARENITKDQHRKSFKSYTLSNSVPDCPLLVFIDGEGDECNYLHVVLYLSHLSQN